MKYRIIITALVCAALPLLFQGCLTTGKGCTLMACSSSLELRLDPRQTAYGLHVAVGKDTLRFTCDAQGAHRHDTFSEVYDFDCKDSVFNLGGWFGTKNPAQLFMRVVDASGRTLLEGPQTPAWGHDYYPNGKECDKNPCQSAVVDLHLVAVPE